ncbi:MAG: NAD+ synthase [Alphaproteobacteria bacterium]|nr:NAD+ synthase [Alphaproteobacteria bacterium]
MSDSLTIALAQTNPTVGAVAANADLIRQARSDAAAEGADIVVFSELNLSGYPPEDLVLRSSFLDAIEAAANELATETSDGGPALIIGAPWRVEGECYNAALVLDAGEIKGIRLKHHLPNYGVFDEKRVFASGPPSGPVVVRGVRLGVLVCEDMWFDDVTETVSETGAEIIIVINGSPFELDKDDVRLSHAVARVSETGLPLVYVNQVGGQDDLAFDGGSFVLNADRALAVQAPWWKTDLTHTTWTKSEGAWICDSGIVTPELDRLENIYQAMVLGLRDYIGKNRFPGVVLGLSGGIDSAISAVVAADALGPNKVHCVMMPSPYTSQDSLEDAAALAANLGVKLDSIGIGDAMTAFEGMLETHFSDTTPDTTEENIQSRIRGLTLMALSNKFGHMVLSTGNKSEVSVGYATLYGDMCGGYNVLKDVYKTTVTALSGWRNDHVPDGVLGASGAVMPERIITKPPTAELRPDQKDEDSLPPYAELDAILKGLIENARSVSDVIADGHEADTVRRIHRLLRIAEYKRRQASPGVKISHLAFGRDHRYPITNAFDGDAPKSS